MTEWYGVDRLVHFLVGVLAGAVALVVFWAIGLPDYFQIFWGAAVALGVWWYFEPDEETAEAEI